MSTDSSLSYSSSDQSNLPIEVAGITKRSVNAFRIMVGSWLYFSPSIDIRIFADNNAWLH